MGALKGLAIARGRLAYGLFKHLGKIQAVGEAGHGRHLLHRQLLPLEQGHRFTDAKCGDIFPHGAALMLLKQLAEIVGVQPKLLGQPLGAERFTVVVDDVVFRRLHHRVGRHLDARTGQLVQNQIKKFLAFGQIVLGAQPPGVVEAVEIIQHQVHIAHPNVAVKMKGNLTGEEKIDHNHLAAAGGFDFAQAVAGKKGALPLPHREVFPIAPVVGPTVNDKGQVIVRDVLLRLSPARVAVIPCDTVDIGVNEVLLHRIILSNL